MTSARVLAACVIASLAFCARTLPAHAQAPGSTPTPAASPRADAGSRARLFATVRLGPVGRTTVRAQAHELAGSPSPAPGLGARVDLPVFDGLLVGFDLGFLFEANHVLRPYSSENDGPRIGGLIADFALSLRPVWRIAHGRVELHASFGVGVTVRALSGALPLTTEDSATDLQYVEETPGWGVLAQAGVGSTFWLNDRFLVFCELLAIARQTNAVVSDVGLGDYLLQVNDTHALLLVGFGMTIGGP